MTDTTKTIFETYEIRKSRKQKTAFLQFVQEKTAAWGYGSRIEKGWCGARNLVIGDPARAKVVYTAHYDTCPVLPFPNFITPKHIGIYLLYQIVVVTAFMLVPMVAAMLLAGGFASAAGMDSDMSGALSVLVGYAVLAAVSLLILAGPANKHTANDNTSGVTVLLDILQTMPEELRADAAFVFFDLEEMGLFGSGGFASRYKKEMKDKLLVNFDCVSDGETILLALQPKAGKYAPVLEKAFVAGEDRPVEIGGKGVFYPSDQKNFPCGVGVAALKRTKKGKILYMNRIHTKNDTVYEEANIAWLTESALRLTKLMGE